MGSEGDRLTGIRIENRSTTDSTASEVNSADNLDIIHNGVSRDSTANSLTVLLTITLVVVLVTGVLYFALAIREFYYEFIFENPSIEFLNVPFPTEKEVYKPGEALWFYVENRKKGTGPNTTYLELIGNGRVIPLEELHLQGSEVGENKDWLTLFNLPLDLLPGVYYLRGKTEYNPNDYPRFYEWRTQEFMVIDD